MMAVHVATTWDARNVYRSWAWKPVEKCHLKDKREMGR
jgi:hypothetical protein